MSDRTLPDLRLENDPLLWPVIEAVDERARQEAMDELVANVIEPRTAAVLERCRRTDRSLSNDDLEEISSLVALRVIRRIRAATISEDHVINALESYLAMLTYNTVHDFRRQRYPERHRLKRSLRYILTSEPVFGLWETAESVVAGLARWKGQPSRSNEDLPTRRSATPKMTEKERPVTALRAIFERIGHPIELETLVDLVAELWEVRDAVRSREFPPDQRRDQLSSIEQRQYMQALWSEIRELPENQRKALLLNLRDSSRANALPLFLLLNIADPAEIAAAAGLTEQELNAIWEELPMDDLTIADRLKLTRQQVIDLRKSARTRLARRMAKWK